MVKKGKGTAKTETESDSVSDYHPVLDSTGDGSRHEPLVERNLSETRRYETRSKKSLLAQCTLRTSPRLRYPIRNVKGIASPSSTLTPPITGFLKATAAIAFPSSTLTPSKTELLETTPAFNNLNSGVPPLPQVRMSAASFSSSSSQVERSKSKDLRTTTADLEEVCKVAGDFLDTVQGSNPLIPPPHEIAPEVLLPLINENQNEGSCANGNGQSRCLARTLSLNCTQIVDMFENSADADEVDSAVVDPSLVTVDGYRVKEEVAPLLRSILFKFGDIAKDCSLESIQIRSMLLETVCGIYLKLDKRRPTDITSWEIKDFLKLVSDLEAAMVNVGWLRKKLEDISGALEESKRYKALKDDRAEKKVKEERLVMDLEKSRNMSRQLEIEAEEARKKSRVLEREVAAVKAQVKERDEAFINSRAKIQLLTRPLVDGLL